MSFEKLSAVVFDLDGTLIDSRADIAAAVNHALVRSGRAALDEVEIGKLIGDGGRTLLSRATNLPESGAEIEALLADYTAHYLAHPADRTRFMDGAEEALDEVALATEKGGLGLRVALCTNKARDITDRVLDKLGLARRFAAIYGGGDGPMKKPSGAPLVSVAQALGIAPSAMVMVGDGPQDILAARDAGCRSIGLLPMVHESARLRESGADALIDSMREVPSVVRRWLG